MASQRGSPGKLEERLALLDDCLNNARQEKSIPLNTFQKLVGKLRDSASVHLGFGFDVPVAVECSAC